MKKLKILFSLFAVLTLFFHAIPAFAAVESPDFTRRGSVSLMVKDNRTKQPVQGGSLEIVQVAILAEKNGNYVYEYTDAFADCKIPLTDIEAAGLAGKINSFAAAQDIAGEAKGIGAGGKIKFSDLTLGLYLIRQAAPSDDGVTISPFLLAIPTVDGERLQYDIAGAPKPGSSGSSSGSTVSKDPWGEDLVVEDPVIDNPAVDNPMVNDPALDDPAVDGSGDGLAAEEMEDGLPKTDTEETLPQTGQLWWPVPLLSLAGVLVFSLGWVMQRNAENE